MMKKYEDRIQEYKTYVRGNCVEKEAQQRTIQACQDTIKKQVSETETPWGTYFEFLYQQFGFIRKRWWLLQGMVLAWLWFWMENYAKDLNDMTRQMGVFATIFVILIVPELWKNQKHAAIEIEQASYYMLRQICAARILLFGIVDFGIVMIFLAVTSHTVAIPLYHLIVNLLLPANVSCCICFRMLSGKWGRSEYPAILLCLMWVSIWMLIVSNAAVYARIAASVWGAMTVLSFAYLVFCVRKSLAFAEKLLKEYEYEVRA